MKNRYIRSLDTVNQEELAKLKTKKVGVIGSGGLGGYVIEMLARMGVGYLRIMDGDVFDESNLNRQLLSNEDNLGVSKAETAKQHVALINSEVTVECFKSRFEASNAKTFMEGMDVVMDCVDNVQTRLLMEKVATELDIPIVHGAVGGWIGQVMTVMPGEGLLSEIYDGGEVELPAIGAASFIPATIASYQVAECIKYLVGKGELLKGKMMYFDLLNNENFIIDVNVEQ